MRYVWLVETVRKGKPLAREFFSSEQSALDYLSNKVDLVNPQFKTKFIREFKADSHTYILIGRPIN